MRTVEENRMDQVRLKTDSGGKWNEIFDGKWLRPYIKLLNSKKKRVFLHLILWCNESIVVLNISQKVQ